MIQAWTIKVSDRARGFPHCLAYHAGVLYVADGLFLRSGQFVKKWWRQGVGNGEFWLYRGIAFDEKRMYVADAGNDRVQVFDIETQDVETQEFITSCTV